METEFGGDEVVVLGGGSIPLLLPLPAAEAVVDAKRGRKMELAVGRNGRAALLPAKLFISRSPALNLVVDKNPVRLPTEMRKLKGSALLIHSFTESQTRRVQRSVLAARRGIQ